MKLTAKQQAWIDYYKQGHTAAEAARLAGYQAKSDHSFGNIGYENLKKLRDFVIDRDAVLESPRIGRYGRDQRLLDGDHPRRDKGPEGPPEGVRSCARGRRAALSSGRR